MTRTTSPPALSADEIGTIGVNLAHLMRFEFKTQGLTFMSPQPRSSILSGRHASRMRGRGLNFEEIRAYVPGDDTRHLDWKASLRAGKPLVRAYTEERDRPVLLVVDQRMPMFFGSQRAMKSVIAAEFAALGAWMAFHAGDRVGGVIFGDRDIVRIRPHHSRARVQSVLGEVARLNGQLYADSPARPDYEQLDHALEGTLSLVPHDSLVCVVSDFAGAGARTQRLLRQLSAHNDVIAALVFDPMFQTMLPGSGRMVVTEGELQVELDFGSRVVREPIESLYTGRLHNAAELLCRSGVPMMMFNTADATIDQLRHFLGRLSPRARLAP